MAGSSLRESPTLGLSNAGYCRIAVLIVGVANFPSEDIMPSSGLGRRGTGVVSGWGREWVGSLFCRFGKPAFTGRKRGKLMSLKTSREKTPDPFTHFGFPHCNSPVGDTNLEIYNQCERVLQRTLS